jgi:hypothetical protein
MDGARSRTQIAKLEQHITHAYEKECLTKAVTSQAPVAYEFTMNR